MAYPLARDLRDRVMFQRRAVGTTALGGTTESWYTLVPERGAKILPLKPLRRGGEEVLADRLQATLLYDMSVRSDSLTRQVTTDDRVVDLRNPSHIFKIKFIEDLDRRGVWLTVQMELGVADG